MRKLSTGQVPSEILDVLSTISTSSSTWIQWTYSCTWVHWCLFLFSLYFYTYMLYVLCTRVFKWCRVCTYASTILKCSSTVILQLSPCTHVLERSVLQYFLLYLLLSIVNLYVLKYSDASQLSTFSMYLYLVQYMY